MKPRTKYEQRVADINATLLQDIAANDVDWFKKVSDKWNFGYGHFCYFTLFTNIQEFEVKRLYRGYKFADKNITHYFFVEIIREFNDGKKKAYCAKHRQMGGYYDCFTYSSDIELRQVYTNWGGYSIADLFELSCASHPQSTGVRVACEYTNPKELARVIKNNPVAENLYKNNDWLFGWLLWNPHPKKVCRAITLAKRHGFVFDDRTAPIWFDMVRSIIYCKKDYHNPVFIAPANLMETHDKFINMEYRKRERDREAKRRRRIELENIRREEAIKKQLEETTSINETYIKRRKRFYDMILTDGLIECRVLRDVKAFEEEGRAMDHCVFRCKYYEKPYSLILSARIGDARVETIEVNLTNYTISQCYGKHDQFTMHHQRIVDLVNSQMDTIKAYNRNRVKKQMKVAV